MEIGVKTDVLLSMTAAIQQHEDIRSAQSSNFTKNISEQALLAETSSCTAQHRMKWSEAAQKLLTVLLGQIPSAEITTSRLACSLASASLKSCSISLFVEHYNAFVAKALDVIREQSSSQASWPHVWTVVTAAFTRVEQLINQPGLRREASSLAGKLMSVLQPTLTFTESASSTNSQSLSRIPLGLLQGLNAGLQALPTAFRTHQKALGQFAAALLASSLVSATVKCEAACTYSLVPRLTGDAETWSSYMQDALSACHSRLDIANLGMDDSALAASAKAALDPQAQSLTAPLQGPNAAQHSRLLGQSVHSIAAVEAALGQLAGFLDALERLLTMSFPVAVPVPAHGILMLLTRILSFDDSARQAGQVPPSASAYLALSAALPALHCCALQLIQTLLWTVQGSLLMHFAPMARLMSGLLQQIAACTALDSAPAATRLRQQVYRTAGELVGQGGLGVAALLGPQAVSCALLELYGSRQSMKRPAEEGLANGHPAKKQKKNKKDDQLPSLELMMDGATVDGLAVAATAQPGSSALDASSAGVQEAALNLLQALLQAWGSGMSQQQRIQIDAATAHIASTASLASQRMSQSFEGSSNQAGAVAVQLAAMKALLASVLSPASHRPAFLPQALNLFTQGLQSSAPQLVHFSQQALMALEGLIHPRAGHTILQPHRHSTNPHPYLSADTAEVTKLGMPKLWSAVMPLTPRPESKTDAAVGACKMQSNAATMAVAQEVFQAGQLYSAAVAKLQSTLTGAGTAGDSPAARQQQASSDAARHGQQQAVDVAGHRHDSAVAGAVARATASTEDTVAAATPAGAPQTHPAAPNLSTHQGVEGALLLQARETPSSSTAEQAVDEGGPVRPVPQAAQQTADQSEMMPPAEAGDGYISLEQHSIASNRNNVSSGMSLDMQRPHTVKGYIQTAAESSDSQGSLPDIDLGESSDSSDSQ